MPESSDIRCNGDVLRAWAETAAEPMQGIPAVGAREPLLASFRIWGPVLEDLYGDIGSFAYRWGEDCHISVVMAEDGYVESDLVMTLA